MRPSLFEDCGGVTMKAELVSSDVCMGDDLLNISREWASIFDGKELSVKLLFFSLHPPQTTKAFILGKQPSVRRLPSPK